MLFRFVVCSFIFTNLASAAEPLFCGDPYQAICARADTHRKARLENIEKKYKEVTAAANGDDSESQRLGVMAQPRYQKFIQSHSKMIRKNLIRAIEASSIPSDKKNSFFFYIQGEEFKLESRSVVCGYHGENPLAEADDTEEARGSGNQVIRLCQGLFLFSPLPSEDHFHLGNEFMIVAHEMAHIMSFYWESQPYQKLASCFIRKDSVQILDEYLSSIHAQYGLDAKYEENARKNSRKVVIHHLEEITSDYWAKEAIAQYLVNEGQTLSEDQKLEFLQSAYGYFCTAQDSGTHPSGKFRIELMGHDPVIRAALGCVSSAPAHCTLDGLK